MKPTAQPSIELEDLGRRLIAWAPLRQFCLRYAITQDKPYHPHLFGVRLSRSEVGLAGENLATTWLKQHGRKVLYRNYRGLHRGEVDIVARHRSVLTFCEVKTRSSTAHGRPADAVNADKQRLIQRGAQDWLRHLDYPKVPLRFDIVEVLLIPGDQPRINVIESAFTLPDSALTGR